MRPREIPLFFHPIPLYLVILPPNPIAPPVCADDGIQHLIRVSLPIWHWRDADRDNLFSFDLPKGMPVLSSRSRNGSLATVE